LRRIRIPASNPAFRIAALRCPVATARCRCQPIATKSANLNQQKRKKTIMKGKKHAILAVLVTVVVDIIMLLIPHANNVAYWVAFVCLTLSGLLFLLPMLFQARDYVTRVPVLIALAVNYVVQIVVLFLSNTGWWRVTMILELIVLLAVAAIALYTSFFEEHNDAANDKLVAESANRYTSQQGGF